jgi:hypothetical protein
MSENTAPETIIDTDTPEGAEGQGPTLPPHFDCLGPELHLTEAQTTLGTDDDGNHLMVANITVKGVPAIVRTLLANLMASPFALLLISDPEFNIYAAAASEGRLGIADEEDEEEEKPKRGRPRKQPAAPAPVQSMQGLGDGEAIEEPVKRGPGRPRKQPAPEAAPAAVAPVAHPPVASAPVPPAPAAVEQPDLFDDLEPAPAAAPKINTALGFNPPASELSKPRVGDLLRYLAQDAHAKGVTMELAIPQIGQWVVDNCERIVALRSQSKDQVAAMLEKSLSKYIESNWPKS